MGEKDISFKISEGKFNYRVGAIIIDSDNILMVKNDGSPFYYTVGGRVKFGESAEEAVLREVFEETQIHFEIDRLAYIHENFFVLESDKEFYHEISLFFLMKANPQLKEVKHGSFKEEYGEVTLHWLPVNGLENLHLYPEFFKTELKNLPSHVGHYMTKNGVTFRP